MLKVLIVLTILYGTANAMGIDFSLGGLRQDPKGTIEYQGTRISLDDDLKLKRRTKEEARLKLEHPIPLLPNIYLQYIPMRFKGVNRITKEIEYGGRRYKANTDLYSKLKFDHLDLGLYWNVGLIQKATDELLDPEFGINVRILGFRGELKGIDVITGQEARESKSFTAPVPMAFLGLGLKTPGAPVSLKGELRALPVSKISYYDLTGEVRIKPVKLLYLSLGYRYEKLRIDEIKDVYSNVSIRGPFVMVGLEFRGKLPNASFVDLVDKGLKRLFTIPQANFWKIFVYSLHSWYFW